MANKKPDKERKNYGRNAAQRFGARLMEQAKLYESKGYKPPINLMVLKTPSYEVEINYLGGNSPADYSVLDTCSPLYEGKPHGYPITCFGDYEALVMGILTELDYIDSIHVGEQQGGEEQSGCEYDKR